MPFITFIYKVGRNNKTYYGKYCTNNLSDDHEGLDNEVNYILKEGLNKYRKQKNIQKAMSKITIGILSFSSNSVIPTYSSNKEIKCFDFYCDYKNNMYINGKLI